MPEWCPTGSFNRFVHIDVIRYVKPEPKFHLYELVPRSPEAGLGHYILENETSTKAFFMKSRCEQSEASSWIEHPLVGFTVWSYAIEVSWVKWSPLNSENIILYCWIHALLSLADSAKLARACSLVCDRISMFFVCGGMAAGGWVLERCVCVCVHIYIYMCIYREREREKLRINCPEQLLCSQ